MTTVPKPLPVAPRQLPGRRYDRVFFAAITVALLITAFAGFARTYYLAGLSSAKLPSPIVHVHAVLESAWMLLLLVQMLLAFVVAIAAYDIWSMRRIHAATLAGAGLIGVFLFGCMPLGHTAAWHDVARWMLSWNL